MEQVIELLAAKSDQRGLGEKPPHLCQRPLPAIGQIEHAFQQGPDDQAGHHVGDR